MKKLSTLISYPFLILRSLPFNLIHLPLKQAIKVPIILHKFHAVTMKGKIIIDTDNVYCGMIHLGAYRSKVFPNDGLTWDQRGGTVIFKGKARIGNHCFVLVGRRSTVIFGDDFLVNAGFKLVSFFGVSFGQSTRFGWDCLVMDSNMHPLYDIEKQKFKRASGPIEIGDYNWFATKCRIMHSVKTPERCIFGMNTTITRNAEMQSYCVMGGDPVRILTRNVMRIIGQDQEDLG